MLDGTRPESRFAGAWQRLAARCRRSVKVAGPRDTPELIAEIADEVTRREAAAKKMPALYLVIYDVGRFRDLRRGEDDFSFSFDRDKPPQPDKHCAEILRKGPAWGVHSLVWCESYNDVTRLVDRLSLREFEFRVAFQMSAADSTSLIDSPAASRLGEHRGLFYSDDLGTQEKFRPYGPPSDEWLARVHARAQRASRRRDRRRSARRAARIAPITSSVALAGSGTPSPHSRFRQQRPESRFPECVVRLVDLIRAPSRSYCRWLAESVVEPSVSRQIV